MTPDQFVNLIRKNATQIDHLSNRVLPVKVGAMAKKHFQENFRRGGCVNGCLQKWKPTNRIGMAKGTTGNYGTLLSGRNHLFSSIEYVPGQGEVTIQNRVPYAMVHNEGGKAGRTSKPFQMPKRQFIGESRELNEQVNKLIEVELNKILK